ncbi:MAG: hypothetical protein IJC04_09170 [Oscillospiraceae bacterium]|nr:hypothetical protein [Oscillospiraceae bacterium]
MKKVVTACSVLSAIISVAALIFSLKGLFTSHGLIVDLALFTFIARGTFMGFIGNVLSAAVLCGGFGVMAFYGFSDGQTANRRAFMYGVAMTIICVLSLIISIVYRTFTVGDLLIAALPAVYTYAVLRSA